MHFLVPHSCVCPSQHASAVIRIIGCVLRECSKRMWRKALQRRFYTFLSTRWGVGLCVIGLLFSMATTMQLLMRVLVNNDVTCANVDFAHNIMETSYERFLFFEPIDIVYG